MGLIKVNYRYFSLKILLCCIFFVSFERDGGWYPRTVSQKYGGIHTYLGRFPWGSSTMQHFEMHKKTAPNLTLSVQNRRWGRWSESSFFRINHPCKHSYVYIYMHINTILNGVGHVSCHHSSGCLPRHVALPGACQPSSSVVLQKMGFLKVHS